MSRCAIVLVIAAAVPVAAGAPEIRTLGVTVTSASGRSVFIDAGRTAGIVTGQAVLLRPAGAVPVEGIVQAVATDTARVELPAGTPLPPPGTPGEVEVPVEPPEPPAPPELQPGNQDGGRGSGSGRSAPDHPPWTRQEPQRSPGMPLLAPAFGQAPGNRPARVDGRIFTDIQVTVDQGGGRHDNYYVGRLGAWLQATNPFGAGGRIDFAGELDYRNADVSFDSGDEFQPIIDVASYTLGGEYYAPYVLQVGRFYPNSLPEIGVIDGVAGAIQLENGLRAGGGFGVYPRPFPDRDWGADLSTHVFADYHTKDPSRLAAILAYQHTWHRGEPDRDLVLGRVAARPIEPLWLYCSWWIDIYTADDVLKGPGVELTQLWTQARYDVTPETSLSLSFSHSTWVETKRQQYQAIPTELIAAGRVDRLELSAWHQLADGLRVTGRVGRWEDRVNDGVDLGAAVDWSGQVRSFYGEVFYTQGSFNDGAGLRIRGTQDFGSFNGYLGYELFAYTATGIGGGQSDFVRHLLQAGVGWTVGHMAYSVNGELSIGDGEGAYSVGAFAEYRF